MPSPTGPKSGIQAQKMMKNGDPEVFINAFERTVVAPDEAQWSAILIPCLIGPSQQVIDSLPLQDLCDYKKV